MDRISDALNLVVAVVGILATLFGFVLRWERRLSRMEGKLNALHRRVDKKGSLEEVEEE